MEDAAGSQRQEGPIQIPLPPPPTQRRGRSRVREVSSRFMSPLAALNGINPPPPPTPKPTGTTPIPAPAAGSNKRCQPPQQQLEPPPPPPSPNCSVDYDENCVPAQIAGSLDSSIISTTTTSTPHPHPRAGNIINVKQHPQPQQQRVIKPHDAKTTTGPRFNSAGGGGRSETTPIVVRDRDRMVQSRYRLPSQTPHRSSQSPATNTTTNHFMNTNVSLSASAAAKLLREATCSTSDDHSLLIDSSSVRTNINRPDLRSSMPEVDVLPTYRWQQQQQQHVARRSFNHLTVAAAEINVDTDSNSSSRSSITSTTPSHSLINNFSQSLKQGAASSDVRKVKKLFHHHHHHHQDDVKHTLKLLYNHYLQWRFVNAKSDLSLLAQKTEAEGQLYSLGNKISKMRERVKNRHIELERLQRIKYLSTTVESQMPYLDEWSALAEDYSHSLSGATDALMNLSLRLPVSGGAKVNMKELKDIFDSAVKVIEMIAFCIRSFMAKGEDMESLVSELARIVGGERTLIQECGDSILEAYASQVEEWSLRGHLVQFLDSKNQRPNQLQQNS